MMNKTMKIKATKIMAKTLNKMKPEKFQNYIIDCVEIPHQNYPFYVSCFF